jgi:2-methylcitrate dehydratase PrpD
MSSENEELPAPGTAAAEVFAAWAAGLDPHVIPAEVRRTLERSVLDIGGLMVAARATDYVQATVAAAEGAGPATAIGHAGGHTAADAAVIGGTAAHGEDFDDTFEGTPVHVGAAVVPAVLAAAEAHGASGREVLKGLAVGGELACRLGVVAPTAIHRAGFHPTAVCGAMGAAACVACVVRLNADQTTNALGIAGSLASGIIEYLAEGTSTKRLHPGWAAQAGIKAARLAKAGFSGPRTVFEGVHGFFFAFAVPDITRDYGCITRDLGHDWNIGRLAYKPYACGTMVQPFIDCAIKLRRKGVRAGDITAIEADVGEGTVHRLWEPVGEKTRPTTPYSAKFSGAYGIAIGFVDGAGGLGQYTEERIRDAEILGVAAKVRYRIDPENEYPKNYTGALKVTLTDGRVVRSSQPHLRGGVHEPLGNEEMLAKFRANAAFGGWDAATSGAFERWVSGLFTSADLKGLAAFRK